MVQFLSSSARRAIRFESVLDGTLELVLGLFHLGWAGSLFLLSVWKDAPAPPVMLVIALALTFAGTRLASHYWKQRITIPRAGYVRRRVGVWLWLLAVVVLIAISNVTANALQRKTGNDALGLGAGMALSFCALALWLKAPRYWIVAGVSLAVTAALQLANRQGGEAVRWFMLLMGIALVVSGMLAMRAFMRTHPEGEEA